MTQSQGSYLVIEASHIEVEDGRGNWYYVGHFLGLVRGTPKSTILARPAGPFFSEAQARTDGKTKAEREAMATLTGNKWPQ